MKITAFIILVFCLHVSASTLAQNVTLSEHKAPLEKVLNDIRQQTGYVFFYNEDWMQQAQPVDINVNGVSLNDALKICFASQPFSYAIVNKTIVLKLKEHRVEKRESAAPVIEGKVVDENDQPLVGATVKIKGKNSEVVTNEKGEFKISAEGNTVVLSISYVGYITQEIAIGSSDNNITVHLKLSNSKLDEVQVIAYGETTQRFSVGSVSKVTAADIEEQPVTNPLQALEGRVPGLVVAQSSGLPGASVQIQIRGQNSLNPNPYSNVPPPDNPFFIIDGVPFSPQNGNINQFGSLATGSSLLNSVQGMSPFSFINPTDIESIEVLRDADATAIYGSRGANGVILITTKRGKVGKPRFSIALWSGASQVTNTMQMMNTQQYLQMRNDAFKNDGVTPTKRNAPDLLLYDTTRYTDWKKYFLGGTAHTTDGNLSYSGGSANTTFFIGSGYHTETTIFPGDFSDNRASVNTNLHHVSTDRRLSMDLSINYSYEQNNSSGSPSSLSAFNLPPDFPALLKPDGSLNWSYNSAVLAANPLQFLYQKYNLKNYNLISHFQVGYQILPGLDIRSGFGYNTLNSNEYSSDPISAQNPARNPTGSANFGTNNFQTWIIEPQVEYKKSIGKGKFDVLVGSTFQKDSNSSTSINGNDYTNDALLGSIASAGSISASDSYSLYKYSALFGRLNYVLNSKYIIDITGRRDGSSRFGPGKQFGNFESIGGGWIFSNERFVKNLLPSLSYGKLRISYGTTGADNIGNYKYISTWTPTNNIYNLNFQGSPGFIPQNLFNPDFSWALTKKLETGLELGLLNDRILANISWYYNRSGNQLVSYILPSQTGFQSVTQNFPGVVQNSGFEIQINSTNITTKKFTYKTSVNLTIPRNILASFPGIASSSYANTYIVGQSLSVLNRYRYYRVNDTTGAYQFLTAKGIPTYNPVNPDDYSVDGNLDPKFYGALRNTFTYNGFQLDIFIEFKKQLGFNYLGQITNGSLPGSRVNLPVAFLSNWQKPGDNSDIEQFSQNRGSLAGNAINYFYYSSGAIGDASYIRFKTVSFSYNFPNTFLKKINMQSCRLYVNAQNLFTITKYKGNDPETQSFYGVPPLKTIIVGLQFIF